MKIDDFERAASAAQVSKVTVDGFVFAVNRLSPMVYEAARQVAATRADTDDVPDGLDRGIAEHDRVWRVSKLLEEVAAAAVTGWSGVEDDVTAAAVRRFVRLAPDKFGDAIFAAAIPPRPALADGVSDDDADDAGGTPGNG